MPPAPEAPATTDAPATTAFADALRVAVERSGLSQQSIRRRLGDLGAPVSAGALSYWISGRSQPERPASIEALGILEEVLGLRQGDLSGLLGAPRPRGRVGGEPTLPTACGPPDGVGAQILNELGFTELEDMPHEIFVHQLMQVDSGSRCQRLVFTLYLRSLRPGPCRVPAVTVFDEGEVNVEPEVTPLEGCHIERVARYPQQRGYGVEIVLDTHLEPGQTAMCRYSIDLRAPARNDGRQLCGRPPGPRHARRGRIHRAGDARELRGGASRRGRRGGDPGPARRERPDPHRRPGLRPGHAGAAVDVGGRGRRLALTR